MQPLIETEPDLYLEASWISFESFYILPISSFIDELLFILLCIDFADVHTIWEQHIFLIFTIVFGSFGIWAYLFLEQNLPVRFFRFVDFRMLHLFKNILM
jgi:hypothetical protein